jgi:hypothetical protein
MEHGFGNNSPITATAKASLRSRPIHTALPWTKTAKGIIGFFHQAHSFSLQFVNIITLSTVKIVSYLSTFFALAIG